MNDELTFALDIGTRTIIGLLLEKTDNKYKIISSAVSEHETRAMLDGQIHNVEEVADEVRKVKNKLEENIGRSLNKVAIAAAGRALKTVTQNYRIYLDKNRYINRDDVRKLELMAIKEAQNNLTSNQSKENQNLDYHFVGYSPISYLLDEIEIGSLVGQRGKKIEVKLVATFLPRIVIDSLLSVINRVGLEVEHLTLEPIAASQVVIPESMNGFNLALVDIGAGTSDIAVTNNGSIIGYDMVPIAGDEITEKISENFLIDYNTAEQVKCNLEENNSIKVKTILGDEVEINFQDVLEAIKPQLDELAGSIAEGILKINSTPPQAVIFIGGGSLTYGLKEMFADKIDMIVNRIGIRKKDDLDNIIGEINTINSTQSLTPIGIAVTTKETQSKAVFVEVEVGKQTVNLLTISNPSIADALLAVDIEVEKLNPSVGKGLTCTVNGELKTVKGEFGTKGSVFLNGREVNLDTKVSNGDSIDFSFGNLGKDADAKISEVVPKKDLVEYTVYLNGSKNKVTTQLFQNDKLVNGDTKIKDGAVIEYEVPKTIKDGISQLMEVPKSMLENNEISFYFNGEKRVINSSKYLVKSDDQIVNLNRPLKDKLNLNVIEKSNKGYTVKDFFKKQDMKKLKTTFNGSDLELPNKIWDVNVNGKKAGLDYEINKNDDIKVKSKNLNVNKVFEYINYHISDKMKDNLNIYINNEPAELSSKIENGDNIKIKLD
ncbi:MAG: cell division protein FtsA [Bacillota bacterium]